MANKIIVTAALTGAIHTPTMSPHLPVTPEQIIDEACAAHEAGAAVAHLHVRNPLNGHPTSDQGLFKEIATQIKTRCDIVLCPTTGGPVGEPVRKRAEVVSNLCPEMASLNAGSLNFALFPIVHKFARWEHPWEKKYIEATEDNVFTNTFKTMKEFLAIFAESGTKPEFEIYDVGMINNVSFLIDAGYAQRPVYLQFVMGILGGIPASPHNLLFLVETAKRQIGNFEFSVCAAGKNQIPLCTQSVLLGGNARVGLEDSLYVAKGTLAQSNAEQVAKVIRIIRELGGEPATPQEAREVLGLKGIERVNF